MRKEKTTIRLIEEVDEIVRDKMRAHGDLSDMIEKAIQEADFDDSELVELRGRPFLGAAKVKLCRPTTISLSVTTKQRLVTLAKQFSLSQNETINSALLLLFRNPPEAKLPPRAKIGS